MVELLKYTLTNLLWKYIQANPLSTLLQVMAVGFSMSGVVFNIHKKKICWILFSISGIFWLWLYAYSQLYISIIPPIVYLFMNFWGWKKWSKK